MFTIIFGISLLSFAGCEEETTTEFEAETETATPALEETIAIDLEAIDKHIERMLQDRYPSIIERAECMRNKIKAKNIGGTYFASSGLEYDEAKLLAEVNKFIDKEHLGCALSVFFSSFTGMVLIFLIVLTLWLIFQDFKNQIFAYFCCRTSKQCEKPVANGSGGDEKAKMNTAQKS